MSLENLHVRNGNDQLAPPFTDEQKLVLDFVLEVPRKNEYVVRLRLTNLIRVKHRDVRAGKKPAVLVGVAVDGVVDKVASQAAVIEKRVSLARRAVAGDRLSSFLRIDEKGEGVSLASLDLFVKRTIGFQPPETSLGQILGDGRDYLSSAWWISVWPGVVIFTLTLCMSILGDLLRDRLDPMLKRGND